MSASPPFTILKAVRVSAHHARLGGFYEIYLRHQGERGSARTSVICSSRRIARRPVAAHATDRRAGAAYRRTDGNLRRQLLHLGFAVNPRRLHLPASHARGFPPENGSDFKRMVTDFYSAYYGLPCFAAAFAYPLMRDMTRSISQSVRSGASVHLRSPFGGLFALIVFTVDDHGLERKYLRVMRGPCATSSMLSRSASTNPIPPKPCKERLLPQSRAPVHLPAT